jgi:hypothetical protein
MYATPYSSEPYFPMLLSNGGDGVLMDFTGSMFSGGDNHAHREQHQGCSCGWYKVGHVRNTPDALRLQPILRTGYLIIINGEAWDIRDYRQEFDPSQAILVTDVIASGVVCRIEAFMMDNHILVEHYRVLKTPAGKTVRMAFLIHEPNSGMVAADLPQKTDLKMTFTKDRRITIDYRLAGHSGAGMMFVDRKVDGTDNYDNAVGIYFDDVRAGWTATKFLTMVDSTDEPNYVGRVKSGIQRCVEEGYAGLRKQHVKTWTTYFNQSRVTLPDKEFQYLYDLSLYMLRANQHPQTGGITVGMLPHLWGGGTYVPYDAFYAHQSLLLTNHLDEGRRHLEFYHRQRPVAQKIARKLDLSGVAYSGWCNYRGEHKGPDFEEYVLHYKPVMSAFILLKIYWQWCYDPTGPFDLEILTMMREILDLAVERIIENKGESAIIKPCTAGNESAIDVENDTFTAIIYARALRGYAQMASALGQDASTYEKLAEKLYRGLEGNYRSDGVLLPFKNAEYLATMQFSFYLFNLPWGIEKRSVYGSLKDAETAWGLNTTQPEEGYRDWPWLSSRAAIDLSVIGDSRRAFKWLRHPQKYISSLGAIPEKIRIDGYPIGYWYTSPHALFIWSTTAAICHDGKNNELRMLWGFDGQWKNMAFQNLRLRGGLLVSGIVKKGCLIKLVLKNSSLNSIQRNLVLNPLYSGSFPREVTVPAGKSVCLGKA